MIGSVNSLPIEELESQVFTKINLANSMGCNNFLKEDGAIFEQKCLDKTNEINNLLNKLWMFGENDSDSIKLFKRMWIDDNSSSIISTPLIKLNLVYLLGQEYGISGDTSKKPNHISELRGYVRKYLMSNNPLLLNRAVSAITYVGEPKDVQLLKRIILLKIRGISEKAIDSVATILNSEVSTSMFMKDILPLVNSQQLKDRISKYIL
tara:strand:- start:877 stop:1500 length:624 start_codon:yes stop_codon:yes gene_type:complete